MPDLLFVMCIVSALNWSKDAPVETGPTRQLSEEEARTIRILGSFEMEGHPAIMDREVGLRISVLISKTHMLTAL